MLEDEIRLTTPDQSKAHADSGIVITRMAHRRIKGEGDADAALDISGLEGLWNRDLVNSEMIER